MCENGPSSLKRNRWGVRTSASIAASGPCSEPGPYVAANGCELSFVDKGGCGAICATTTYRCLGCSDS